MKFTKFLCALTATFALSTSMIACGGVEGDEGLEEASGATSGSRYKIVQKTPTVGGSCRIASGSNAGKTGTYTKDASGNFWCEGTDRNGNDFGSQCGTNNVCQSIESTQVD